MPIVGITLPEGATVPPGTTITATISVESTFIPDGFLPECGDMYKVLLSLRVVAAPFETILCLFNGNVTPIAPMYSKRHGYLADYTLDIPENEGNLGRTTLTVSGFAFGEDYLVENIELVRRIALIRPTTDLSSGAFATAHEVFPGGEPCYYFNTPASRSFSVEGSIQIYDGATYSDPAVFQTVITALPLLSCEGGMGPDDPPWSSTTIGVSTVAQECVPVSETARTYVLAGSTTRTEI